jgi:hypothetical protein
MEDSWRVATSSAGVDVLTSSAVVGISSVGIIFVDHGHHPLPAVRRHPLPARIAEIPIKLSVDTPPKISNAPRYDQLDRYFNITVLEAGLLVRKRLISRPKKSKRANGRNTVIGSLRR